MSKGAIGPSHGLVFVQDDLKRYELPVCKLKSESESSFVLTLETCTLQFVYPTFKIAVMTLKAPMHRHFICLSIIQTPINVIFRQFKAKYFFLLHFIHESNLMPSNWNVPLKAQTILCHL